MDGIIRSGEGAAAEFVAAVEDQLTKALGFRPFLGTLNLSVKDRTAIETFPERLLSDVGNDHCNGVHIRPCSITGVHTAVLRPIVPDYPEGRVELVAPISLRTLFDLEDGDTISLFSPEDRWFPDGLTADPMALDAFDAVVFDLDGTLVDLDVDWTAVHSRFDNLLGDDIDGSVTDYTRPEVMDLAREGGKYDELTTLLEKYECTGAQTADELSLLASLADLDCPVGICTANAMSAAKRTLDRFDVLTAIDVIVARETVREEKPDPRPLTYCLNKLGATAGDTVFVGDERSDAEAATAAGTSFLHTKQLRSQENGE